MNTDKDGEKESALVRARPRPILGAVILAARPALADALGRLAGRPIMEYAVATAAALTGEKPALVAGGGADALTAALADAAQADAVLVIPAEMPLLTEATLHRIVADRRDAGAAVALLTASADDARGRGRVLRDAAGQVQAVLAEDACTPEQRATRELDAGVYCFDAAWLRENLAGLPVGPDGECRLADLVGLAAQQGRAIAASAAADPAELLVVHTRADLAAAEAVMRARINRRWLEADVMILDPATTYIDDTVRIGPHTTVLPNTYLWGQTTIGSSCRIGPGSLIQDCQIGDRCAVTFSVLEQAIMEDESDIGPFGHLRSGARVCRGAHMGNFGEMKNSTLGPGSKMGHFSYLGDATVGANVNIGAGTITCNFDGERKHPTVIEDDVFIGSDSMLVAPVRIAKGARTGAGSVVTHDVPAGAVVYGVPARVKRQGGEQ